MCLSMSGVAYSLTKEEREILKIIFVLLFRSSDTFIGSSLMSNLTLEHLSTVLAAVPSDSKSIELMVHPGYPNIASDGGCGCGPDDFSRDIWRQRELECLVSVEFHEFLRNHGFTIQSWEK